MPEPIDILQERIRLLTAENDTLSWTSAMKMEENRLLHRKIEELQVLLKLARETAGDLATISMNWQRQCAELKREMEAR